MSTLAEALFTRTQRNVLQLLYGQPAKSFYTNEILRLTGMGVHTIKRELGRMVSAGILTTKNIGNQKHYQANSACPTYKELVSIVKKTVGVVGVLRDALVPQTGNITIAFVYGSIAKGGERSDSDIDLMVVGSHLAYADVMEALLPAEAFLDRKINPALYTAVDFKLKIKQKNHFLTRVVQQEKLFVLGSEDDIEQLEGTSYGNLYKLTISGLGRFFFDVFVCSRVRRVFNHLNAPVTGPFYRPQVSF